MIRSHEMRTRAQGLLAFTAILATCVAGIIHFSWWAAIAGACVLALISLSNHPVAYRALSGSASSSALLVFSSLFNATITSAGALLAGRLISWAWGA
jgi:hypothetical protein